MTKKVSEDINFTQALQRLEEIVQKLEEPDLDLEEGLKLLEEGVKLHKLCKSKLTQASDKISQVLKEDSPDVIIEEEVIL
ncbi:MAG: exodeoxyribonuclease VII small subunit [Candidatus Curtissbacteria bacterium]